MRSKSKSSRSIGVVAAAVGAVSLAAVDTARAGTPSITFIETTDFAHIVNDIPGTFVSISGLSQDGSTVVGTVDLNASKSAGGDRAFYYRVGANGQPGQLGFVDPSFDPSAFATSWGVGISADGNTVVDELSAAKGAAQGQGLQLDYVTNLAGLDGSAQQVAVLPTSTAVGGVIYVGNTTNQTSVTFKSRPSGNPLSADGSTIVGSVYNGTSTPISIDAQVSYSAGNGLAATLVSPTLPVNQTSGSSAPDGIPVGVSADGSVIVGNLGGFGNKPPQTPAANAKNVYRSVNGVVTMLYTDANSTIPATGATVLSADGNTVGVSGGIWRANAAQHFLATPNVTSLNGGTNVVLTAPTPIALTADGSWAGGAGAGVNGADYSTGWIWNTQTDQIFELTQFLSDHGIDTSDLIPGGNGGTNDMLISVTGLALNSDELTIAGNTAGFNNSSSGNAFIATVEVPEPTSIGLLVGASLLMGRRQRRAAN